MTSVDFGIKVISIKSGHWDISSLSKVLNAGSNVRDTGEFISRNGLLSAYVLLSGNIYSILDTREASTKNYLYKQTILWHTHNHLFKITISPITPLQTKHQQKQAPLSRTTVLLKNIVALIPHPRYHRAECGSCINTPKT